MLVVVGRWEFEKAEVRKEGGERAAANNTTSIFFPKKENSHPRPGAPRVDDEHVSRFGRQGRREQGERKRQGEQAAEEQRR